MKLIKTLVLISSVLFPLTSKAEIIHICKKTDPPKKVLACNLYNEARGEGKKGMMAVGFVTLNRLNDDAFPDTVQKVVYQKSQFSWTSSKKASTFKVKNKEVWNKAVVISSNLIALYRFSTKLYSFFDMTNGSLYYHNTSVKPYWTKSFHKEGKYGNHIFYSRSES